MNPTITFTLTEVGGYILAICGGIITISGAIIVIQKFFRTTPNYKQNERISILEDKVKRHDEILDSDNRRLKDIEDGNRIVQRSILALLSHGIDGNDIDSMKKARDELQEFLISR